VVFGIPSVWLPGSSRKTKLRGWSLLYPGAVSSTALLHKALQQGQVFNLSRSWNPVTNRIKQYQESQLDDCDHQYPTGPRSVSTTGHMLVYGWGSFHYATGTYLQYKAWTDRGPVHVVNSTTVYRKYHAYIRKIANTVKAYNWLWHWQGTGPSSYKDKTVTV
jgi:hypothetical protein